MKLISMTDFVLQERSRLGLDGNTYQCFTEKTTRYANFLKRPLELWMFIPCDEDSNVLDEFDYLVDIDKHNDWFKAKEKCLFEGFVLDDKYLRLKDYLFAIHSDMKSNIEDFGNIEKLIYHYLSNDIELTQTALKQIRS